MALFRTVWFLESVLSEIFVVFAVRTFKPFYLSMPSMLLISTSVLATLAAVGIIYSPLASFFQFAPLSAGVLGIVLGIVVVYVLVVEAAKHAFFWIENRREEKQKARAQV
jgi:Mg2+-importing ATPase